MPLTHSAGKGAFSSNVARERAAGKPKDQALAIAYRVQREAKKNGMVRGGSIADGGLIDSDVPGRTDRIKTKLHSNSYVIPADILSALGQGNSLAGASALNKLFKMGPYGSSMPHIKSGARQHFSRGGSADVIVAGGEYTVPPEKVAEIGGGDVERGHNVLDELVRHVRAKAVKTLKSLPGPKRS